MRREFLTRIEIDASVDHAWGVLTSFDRFHEWCPTLRSVEGSAVVGAKLALRLATSPGDDQVVRLSAKVRTVNPTRDLAWGGGVPGLPWLLDVHHWFRFEVIDSTHCRLLHGERFQGLLLPLVWPFIGQRVQAGYPAFNAAFKQRCES